MATTKDPSRPAEPPGIVASPTLPPGRPQSASFSSVHFAQPSVDPHPSIISLGQTKRAHFTAENGPARYPSQSELPKSSMSTHHTQAAPSPSTLRKDFNAIPSTDRPDTRFSYPLEIALSPSKRFASGSSQPTALSSPSRRTISEGVTGERNKSESVKRRRKRPSAVTGGFETSSDDTSTSEDGLVSVAAGTRFSLPISQSFAASRALHGPGARSAEGRRRTQSLMLPTPKDIDGAPSTGADVSGTSGLGFEPRRLGSKISVKGAGRQASRERMLAGDARTQPDFPGSPLRISSQRSSLSAQSPLLGNHQLLSVAPSAGPSRSPSSRFHPQDGPSRSDSGKVRDVQRLRRQGITSSPENGLPGRISSPEGSRKGKERERERDSLAVSLGLEGGTKVAALSPEQINKLLANSDLSAALRLMSGSYIPGRPPVGSGQKSVLPISPYHSPSSTRPGSPEANPPTRLDPFIPSAPPALTGDDGDHKRERTVSTSTTNSLPHISWTRNAKRTSDDSGSPDGGSISHGSQRRSTRGAASMQENGGHVTSFHPTSQGMLQNSADDSDTVTPGEPQLQEALHYTNTAALSRGSNGEPGLTMPTTGLTKKHSRLSQLFHIKKKKSDEVLSRSRTVQRVDTKATARSEPLVSSLPSDRAEHGKEKEREQKEAEMKQKEQERREAEITQERRFRALTQVAAHPDAERLAYRASSHLRAHYNLLYEGIENPPRMNPLAVLRWRARSDDQAAARGEWDAKQAAAKHSAAKDNTSMQVQGPGGAMHSSPVSMNDSSKSGKRRSIESTRPTSLGSSISGYGLSSTKGISPASKERFAGECARHWRYTTEDVEAYKECGGVVNYFIAPRATGVSHSGLMEADGEANPRLARSPSTKRDDARSDSVAGSSAKIDFCTDTRVASPSVTSLIDGDQRYLLSPESSIERLSRSTSQDKTPWAPPKPRERLTHRHHQSLGAMGSQSITHALKLPFEKLGHVARRQLTAPHLGNSPEDGDHIRRRHSPLHLHGTSPFQVPPRSANRKPDRAVAFPASRVKETTGLIQREEANLRDEDHHELHLRKLFLKGGRAVPLDDRHPHGFDSSPQARNLGRQAELRALDNSLARESAFRSRQVEADHRSQLEIEARARIRQVEEEIYADRVEYLSHAQKRLDKNTAYFALYDDNMRHYLSQIDQVRAVAKISADVVAQWPDLDTLRSIYAPLSMADGDVDANDAKVISNERIATPESAGSQRRQNALSLNSKVLMRPHRKSTLNRNLPALFSFGVNPWPRRTQLDPSGCFRVDPIRRAELTLDHVRERQDDMARDRGSTTAQLTGMIASIDSLIRQKELVRAWTKAAADGNRVLQASVDGLHSKIRGGSSGHFGRNKDWIYNTAGRGILFPIIRAVYTAYFIISLVLSWLYSFRSFSARADFRRSRDSGSIDMPWGLLIVGVGMAVAFAARCYTRD